MDSKLSSPSTPATNSTPQVRNLQRPRVGHCNTRACPRNSPLLAVHYDETNPSWEINFAHPRFAYLADHRVQGGVIFPAAGYIEIGLAMISMLQLSGSVIIEDLRVKSPLRLSPHGWPRLHVQHETASGNFGVYSKVLGETDAKLPHATARIRHDPLQFQDSVALEDLRGGCVSEVNCAELYRDMRKRGLQYGPSFQCLREVRTGPGRVLALIEAPPDVDHHFHPAVLDAALQSLLAMPELAVCGDDLYLPARIRRVRFHERPGAVTWSYSTLSIRRRSLVEADLVLFDGAGEVLMQVAGLQCLRYGSANHHDKERLSTVAEPVPA